MRISHLSLLEKFKPHLDPSSSQDQTLVWAGLAFSPLSDKFERLELVNFANVCFHLPFKSQTKTVLSANIVFFFEGEGGGRTLLLHKCLY